MQQSRSLDSYRQAKVALEKAVALDPQYARAWWALAELYYLASGRGYLTALGFDKNGAQALVEKALAHPTVQAYRAQALQLAIAARIAEIPAVLDRMEELEPNHPITYDWRGVLSAFNGDIESAFEHYQSGLRLDPAYPVLIGRIGRLHIQAGQYPEAVKRLELSMALDEDAPYLADLTAAHALAGQMTAAQQAAKRLLADRKARGHLLTIVSHFGKGTLDHADYRDHLHEGLKLAGIPERATAKDMSLLPEHRLSCSTGRAGCAVRG